MDSKCATDWQPAEGATSWGCNMSVHRAISTMEPQNESLSFTHEEWGHVVDSLNMSPRQADIVRLILAGKRDKQIAMILGMSVATVRTHLRNIFVRQHVTDRVELVLSIFAVLRSTNPRSNHYNGH